MEQRVLTTNPDRANTLHVSPRGWYAALTTTTTTRPPAKTVVIDIGLGTAYYTHSITVHVTEVRQGD